MLVRATAALEMVNIRYAPFCPVGGNHQALCLQLLAPCLDFIGVHTCTRQRRMAAHSPFIQMTPSSAPATPTPALRGRGTGAKRGRKPRGAFPNVSSDTGRPQFQQTQTPNTPAQFTPVHWAMPAIPSTSAQVPASGITGITLAAPPSSTPAPAATTGDVSMGSGDEGHVQTTDKANPGGTTSAPGHPIGTQPRPEGGEEEGEDEMLPAMADDDYSAQLSWQSESKDNLKFVSNDQNEMNVFALTIACDRVLMDNFSPAQYDRFEAYRRHALPKQAVRRVR